MPCLFRHFLHRSWCSWCCRPLFQTTSSTATSGWSYSTLALSASADQHHTANQVRELVQISSFEPACSQSDPFCNAKCYQKKGARFRMLAVPTLHSCTLGLQDQLNLPGAARDTNSNTEQPSTVTAYEFVTLYLRSTAQNWTRRSRDVQAVSKIL